MKPSRRAQRMDRRHKRKGLYSGFNLVSLMDIFTILVFFLLISSSEGEILPNTKSVDLPQSTAQQRPERTLTIQVNDEALLVQGNRIASVSDIAASGGVIQPLADELAHQRQRDAKGDGGRITIMADKHIPYRLLKRIMLTCTHASYNRISLAVMQKGKQAG